MALDANNPLGLDGFEFCEFTSPDPGALEAQFRLLGLRPQPPPPDPGRPSLRPGADQPAAQPRTDRAGRRVPRRARPVSASGMAFRVADAGAAYDHALGHGAKPADPAAGTLGEGSFVLEGIGGSNLYLVDRHGAAGDLYADWNEIPGWREEAAANDVGLDLLDHLTHNVNRGEMRTWSTFYQKLFGFEEQKYFDIKGQATGLFSQAMIAPDKAIRIPLNESQDDSSQIEEYLREYKGEGIQHLALTTDDIYDTVEKLRARGVRLQDTIETYFELIDKRVPGHGEDVERLRRNRILIDGSVGDEGILLQIFTENMVGPIFFEIIQRKGNEGFGNGNFQALFESIELDQIRRGVIKVDA